jgi:hypothetical protein
MNAVAMAPMKQPTKITRYHLCLINPLAQLTFKDCYNSADHVCRRVIERLVEGGRPDESSHEAIVVADQHEPKRGEKTDGEQKRSAPEFRHGEVGDCSSDALRPLLIRKSE